MHFRRTHRGLLVFAPAKINLFLELLARRPDGYHDLETLICALSIGDTLEIANDSSGTISLTCQWDLRLRTDGLANPHLTGDLPTGEKNLAWRAIDVLRRHAGVKAGAILQLHKRIPSQSGLGGASADAAAALWGANQVWRLGWSDQQLQAVAAELGSDVPFFLAGSAAVCRGRGELLEPVRLPTGMQFVIVRPPTGLSTPVVFRQSRVPEQPRSVLALVESLRMGRAAEAGRLLHNRLQEPAASLSPWIGRLQAAFARAGVWGHQMSGSGSSYFGWCRSARQARRLSSQLQGAGLGSVFLATSI